MRGTRTQTPNNTINNGNVDKGLLRRSSMFIAATQATVLGQPGIGAFDDPADGQLDEAFVILGPRNNDDLATRLPPSDELGEAGLGVGGVAVDGVEVGII